VRRPSPATLASLGGLARMGMCARRFLPPDPSAPAIDVRVVVPARDEATVIGGCVASLVGQATEVVVVDDGSSDGTGERAAQAGARVVRLDETLPEGWMGKPRACLAGAAGATTEWLAFVDSDVVLHPSALPTMATATRARPAGATSVSPTSMSPSSMSPSSMSIVGGLDCRTFWERLLLPELGLSLAQAGFPDDFASGQCFLVRRAAYEAVGGHGHPDVRGSVVDDRDLARVLTGHHARLAPKLMKARMYRDLGGIRAGLVKNEAALHPRSVPRLAGLLAPVATRRPWAAMVVSAGGRAVAGQNPLYGLLSPVARVLLAAFHVESRWRAATGRPVTWKGRPARPLAPTPR